MNLILKDHVESFIQYKKGNGHVYKTAGYHLYRYLEFSADYSPDESVPGKATVQAFLREYTNTPGNLYNITATLREFSRYLVGLGYASAYVISPGRVSLPVPVRPYLFTDHEIEAFFTACDSLKYDPHSPKRHVVLPAMYRLHYCCGLRCKETRTLKRESVDLTENCIDIWQSKGPKSRRIFISEELASYLYEYDEKLNYFLPGRTYFFPSREDVPYGAGAFQNNFLKIWYTAFPEKKNDGVSIRAYDFRHHLAYANMNRWLREGKDVGVMLPYLMKYMGHQDLESTLYYFHLVPEIYGEILKKASVFEGLLPEVAHEQKDNT